MSFLDELKWRGLLNNVTNENKLKLFELEKGTAYIGFDPSGDSLHLGNYIMILILRRLQQFGLNGIAVIGGATGQIGDPSGKKSERLMLDIRKTRTNALAIQKQLKKYGKVPVFNNETIYRNVTLFDFLRDTGKLINVNYLLEKDIIKSRLDTGISYAEFSYNIIQGNDFAWLYKNKHVTMQIGGSDQWGNITTGIEMIRKLQGDNNKACGLTINLLTKEDGTKFGKSESGAIYLEKKYTSAFVMYQFLYNQADPDVEKLLKYFTFLTKSEIETIIFEHQSVPFKRNAQKKLAEIVVTDIHGTNEYKRCLKISDALFKGNIEALSNDELYDGLISLPTINATQTSYNVIDLLILCGACASKTEGRKLIESNAIYVNNKIVHQFDLIVSKNEGLSNKFSYVKKGKKNYYLIKW